MRSVLAWAYMAASGSALLSLQSIRSCLALHTGELFFIGYQMDKKPACCWYAGLDKQGALQFDVRVPLQVSHP